MDTRTRGKHAEQDLCPHCGASGLTHEVGCPNRRIWVPAPGAPGPPVSAAEKTVLDATARLLDGRPVGQAGEQLMAVVKAIVAQAGQEGTRIDIRDNTILVLNLTDIRGTTSISASISALAQSGYTELAEALKRVTEAVTNCLEITSAHRSELLELLDELSKQAILSRSERVKPAVIKEILTGLATGLGAAGGLAEVWSAWGPSIRGFFGV
jgi:hypothetical protein